MDGLTLPEVAHRLGRSISTVRAWERAHRAALRVVVGQDGYRRYELDQFRIIERMADDRRSSREIRAALTGQAPERRAFEAEVLDRLERLERLVRELLDREAGRG